MSERDKKSQVEEPIDTAATPTIAAFRFQFERALYALLSADTLNKRVGIETLDDVADLTTRSDGTVVARLEQDAHTVREGHHPFQDSSRKFWHTLRVWLSHLVNLRDYAEVVFCLVTNAKVPEGALARQLSNTTEENVGEAVAWLRAKAAEVCENGKSAAKKEAEKVIEYSDADLAYLLLRLELLDEGGATPSLQPRDATMQRFVLHTGVADQQEEIYERLLGYAIEQCRRAWQKNEPAWLWPQMFRDVLHEEVTRRSLNRYLDRPMMSTGFKTYVQKGGKDHYFLRQLARLGLPDGTIDNHLDKYWAFYAERVHLEDAGINPDDWLAREDELHQRWRTCRENAEMELEDATPEQLGKRTLAKTLDDSFRAPLGEYETRNLYFTHGHYHELANRPSAPCFVFWHSDFDKSLYSKGEDDL
ncbi:ABC-three component system protein [Paraburkholderia strydomiana]|uniref:ABC-three component systems C-terminal domain-containing protein n=1 Tax=Paraburkholderia strydomiana TaxID=1245417 RepID=A0ABW9BVN7_9BURK